MGRGRGGRERTELWGVEGGGDNNVGRGGGVGRE